MKRIGIDCRLWSKTGVGRYIQHLVKELEKDTENRYFLFTTKSDYESVINSISSQNMTVIVMDIHWHSFAEQILFPWRLLSYRLDLMHFPYYAFPLVYPKKFIVTIHDMIPWTIVTNKASTLPKPLYLLKQTAYRFELMIGLRRAEKIITVSHAAKAEIVKLVRIPENKILVTYEGIDTSLFEANDKQEKIVLNTWKLQPKKYFLVVGNLYPHKNLDKLVTAFASFTSLEKNIFLVFVGTSNYFSRRLERYIQEHTIPNVIFTDFLPDKDLGILYRNSLAAILPSLSEGFGLPALEAIANETVFACSDIPVLKEICGDAALYFNPLDTTDMTRVLQDINMMSSQKRTSILSRARKRLTLFSWAKMGEETREVYSHVL